jgi:ABC-type nitrate/sulfonate/bicarbonate transport system substrate-binding protein
MNRFKLTPVGKLVVFLLFAIVAGAVTYFMGGFDSFLGGKVDLSRSSALNNGTSASADVIQLSLDERIGWKPILDANGGVDTKPGSIYDRLGLKVHINVIADANHSSTSLINGSLHAAGYTINRLAFLYPKFRDNNCPVKMVYVVNTSTGGDGIIAANGINRIEDLVGKRIGVPRYSEAQTLIEWLLAKSSLSDAQVAATRRNFKYFNTPDDAAKAFFGGQLDAAATWQPYLSQAASMGTAHVLFDTKAATNIVIDGILFRADFVARYPDKVAKFIEGSMKAYGLYKTEFTPIKDTFSMFATETNENIKAMSDDATLTDYATNVSMLEGVARTLYVDMCTVWTALNEKADSSAAGNIFDAHFVKGVDLKAIYSKTFARYELGGADFDEEIGKISLVLDYRF